MADWWNTAIPRGCAAITKSNSVNDPAGPFRAVWVNTSGNLKVTFADGSTGVFAVAGGTRFEGDIARVWDTGTDAGVTTGLI